MNPNPTSTFAFSRPSCKTDKYAEGGRRSRVSATRTRAATVEPPVLMDPHQLQDCTLQGATTSRLPWGQWGTLKSRGATANN
jgi:hypothetical protein